MDTYPLDPPSGSPDAARDSLSLATELAAICREAWPAMDASLRQSGVPLCLGEDDDPPETDPADPVEPAPGASTQPLDWDSDDNPYRKRFEDYRRTADQKVTRLSQYEQAVQDFQTGDPAEMRRAAAILGIADHLEIEDPAPPEYDDPTDELAAKYAALEEKYQSLEGKLTAKEQADKEATEVALIQSRLTDLGLDPKSDQEERDLVLGRAFTMPLGDDGLPDVQAAFDAIVARDKARKQANGRAYRDGKRAAPGSIAPGSTATQQKKPTDMLGPDGALTQEGLDHYAQVLEDRA